MKSLTGRFDDAGAKKQANLKQFSQSLMLYRKQEFEAALAGFETILATNPEDRAGRVSMLNGAAN
jgi:hypothetical protein